MTVDDPRLDERIVLVAKTLARRRIAFAFGGALALAYHAEPRATIDIDLNVFVGVDQTSRVLRALRSLAIAAGPREEKAIRAEGQARLSWDRYLLDVFFAVHPFHDSCAKRVRDVSFGDQEIPILSAEDLVVFKLLFNRPKDWLDIEQVLFAQAGHFDVGYVEHWVGQLIDKADERRLRLDEAVRRVSGAG